MASDVKAGGAYVELMLQDKKFLAGLQRAKSSLIGFAKGAAVLGGAITAVGVAAVGVGLKNVMSLGDELDKMRQRTGISVEALSELRHAAGQSGAALTDIQKGVVRMNKSITDANDGLVSSAELFDNLGLSVKDLNAMNPEQRFMAVSRAIDAVQDPARKSALAMEVFGRSGVNLLPMIEDLDALRQEARDLGFVMSGETAASAVKIGDMLANLWETLKQGSVAIGAAALPFLEVAIPAMQAFATAGLQTVQGWAQGISENVGAVSNFIGTVWGGLLDWWHTAQTAAMSALVYLTNNWQVLLETAMVSAQLSVVRFANQVIYFFGTAIPGYLSWFGDNWKEVFIDLASITKTIAVNIWENLKSLWDGIVGLFSGEGFSFEWTPLTQGFESAIKELPKIAEREIGPLEKSLQEQLDGLGSKVVAGIEQHKKDMPALAKEFVAAGDPIAAMIAKQKENTASGGEEVSAATSGGNQAKRQVLGSFSAAALQAGAGGGDPTTSEVKGLRDDQKKQHKELVRAVQEGGALS